MSLIENVNNSYSAVENSTVSNRLDKINQQLKDLPAVLDKETLNKLRNGEYEISLKEYTDMNTYRTTMQALYGNSSANKFPSILNKFVGNQEDKVVSAKNFIERMEEKGVSKGSAIKLYTALKTYSATSSLLSGINYNFVSAKI